MPPVLDAGEPPDDAPPLPSSADVPPILSAEAPPVESFEPLVLGSGSLPQATKVITESAISEPLTCDLRMLEKEYESSCGKELIFLCTGQINEPEAKLQFA